LNEEDIINKEEEEINNFLFSIAVYIKNNPINIKALHINSVSIPESLMNTYSVALQVMI